MLTTCSEPGCATLVMGGRCIEHERQPARTFVRGRPFAPRTESRLELVATGLSSLSATGAVHASSRRQVRTELEAFRS